MSLDLVKVLDLITTSRFYLIFLSVNYIPMATTTLATPEAIVPVELDAHHDNIVRDTEKASATSHVPAETVSDDLLVQFSIPDAHNPKDWKSSRKWVVTCVLSVTGFNRIMISTMMAPALPLLMQQFNMSSAEANMALSVYLLAAAFGPLVSLCCPERALCYPLTAV